MNNSVKQISGKAWLVIGPLLAIIPAIIIGIFLDKFMGKYDLPFLHLFFWLPLICVILFVVATISILLGKHNGVGSKIAVVILAFVVISALWGTYGEDIKTFFNKPHSVNLFEKDKKDASEKTDDKKQKKDQSEWQTIDSKVITYGPNDVVDTGLPVMPGDSIIYKNPTAPIQVKERGQLVTYFSTVRNASLDEGTPFVRGAKDVAEGKIGNVTVIIKRKNV